MFNFNDYKNKKVVMHCKTEEEAKAFCKEMHMAGLKWGGGKSYLEYNYFHIYRTNTCYNFNEGFWGNVNYYKENGYEILEYSDYAVNVGNYVDKFAINCKTEEEANKLLKRLDEQGYVWNSRETCTNKNNWHIYQKNTCYIIHKNEKRIGYTNIYTAKSCYKMIEYSEYMKEMEKASMNNKNSKSNFQLIAKFITDYFHAKGLISEDKTLTEEDIETISIFFKIARQTLKE